MLKVNLLDKSNAAKPPHFRSYFKVAGTVMLDRIVNGIYDIDCKKLSEGSTKAKQEHPKFSKVVDGVTRWGFWYGIAQLGGMLGKYIGDVLAYTLAFSHPTLISLAKHATDFKQGLKEMFKPSIRSYSTTFSILELGSVPLVLWMFDSIAKLSTGTVSVGVGILSAVCMTLSGFAFEYLGFRLIWKKFVLREMQKGTFKDEVKGFIKEFKPFKVLKERPTNEVPKTAGEYIGRVWGEMETNWVWIQIVRTMVAGLVAGIYPTKPSEFMGEYFRKSAEWGKGYFDGIVSAKNYGDVEKRIEEIEKLRTI